MDELEAQIEKEEESLKLFQTEIDRRQELGLVLQSQSELEQAGQMQLFL
jgi:multidrug resistance efflux pump